MSNKTIFQFVRQSTPQEKGYADILMVTVGESLVYRCNASTWCNPYSPTSKTPYYAKYGAVALGTYSARCVVNEAYGKCVLIQNGESLKGVWANVNHDWNKVISEVFIHCGGIKSIDPNWRGSAGCFTMAKKDFDAVMKLLKPLEEIVVSVTGREYTLGLSENKP